MNDTPLPTAANFYGFEPAGRDATTTKLDVAIVPAMSRLYLQCRDCTCTSQLHSIHKKVFYRHH